MSDEDIIVHLYQRAIEHDCTSISLSDTTTRALNAGWKLDKMRPLCVYIKQRLNQDEQFKLNF